MTFVLKVNEASTFSFVLHCFPCICIYALNHTTLLSALWLQFKSKKHTEFIFCLFYRKSFKGNYMSFDTKANT